MSSVGTILVRRPGDHAEQLLRCLRANARQYNVGIEHDPQALKIVDNAGPFELLAEDSDP